MLAVEGKPVMRDHIHGGGDDAISGKPIRAGDDIIVSEHTELVHRDGCTRQPSGRLGKQFSGNVGDFDEKRITANSFGDPTVQVQHG